MCNDSCSHGYWSTFQLWTVCETSFQVGDFTKEAILKDFTFVLVTILFFIVSLGYVRFCERLK
jgi:hypothetical protein